MSGGDLPSHSTQIRHCRGWSTFNCTRRTRPQRGRVVKAVIQTREVGSATQRQHAAKRNPWPPPSSPARGTATGSSSSPSARRPWSSTTSRMAHPRPPSPLLRPPPTTPPPASRFRSFISSSCSGASSPF